MKQILSLAIISLLFSSLFFSSCAEEAIMKDDNPVEATDNSAAVTGNNGSTMRVADPGTKFDESKFDDANWPVMREWQKAGTAIPWYASTPVKKTISATNNSANLQAAIDEVAAAGGGQLKLNNGIYIIDAPITVKSNVRIVGASNTATILKITMRSTTKTSAIRFTGSQNAGLDKLQIEYDGEGNVPNPSNYTNAYPNYFVSSVYFSSGAKNCWLQGCRIINAGCHPVSFWNAQNITIRDCYIDGSFNKGDGGSGYVAIQAAKYILMYNNTVKNIRHLLLAKTGCIYNVVYKNTVNVDVNFHDGDNGNNLVEGNTINLPKSHLWNALQGGDPAQHIGPGPGNIIWANTCYNPDSNPTDKYTSSSLYWLTVGESTNFNFYASDTSYSGAQPFKKPLPPGNTFYPVIE